MSSSAKEPNNRYKSRLLNFFNRQAIQLGDRLGTTFRNVKVATEWGLQIVLYPIYLMVQAGLSVGKQLGQQIEQSSLLTASADSDSTQEEELETLTVDRPIEGVLKAIEQVSALEARDITPLPLANLSEGTSVSVDSQTSKTEILGIASLLETKNLVLIDRNNQILDILDPQQQEKLKQSITWEVANYYRDRRLLIESQQKVPDRLLNISPNNNHVLPPVRLFWQTMDWVQQSPVAMAIDLFGESRLPLRYPTVRDLNSSSEVELQPTGFLATIDDSIADLETKQLLPSTALIDRLGDNWQEILQKLPLHLKSNSEITISKRSENLPLATTNSTKLVSEHSRKLTDRQETTSDPFQIQALIRAAIDYFFGRQGEGVQLEEKIVSEKLLRNRQQQSYLRSKQENPILSGAINSESEQSETTQEDPWLSWEDLFDNSVSTESLPKNPPNTYRDRVRVQGKLQLSKGKLPFSSTNKPKKSLTDSLKLSQKNDRQKSLQVRQSQSNSLVKNEEELTQITTDSRDSDRLSTYHYSSSDLSNEAKRDWWEVESTPIGYEKHLLERILELLDRVILLLENVFVFIWRKIKRLFKK